VYSELFVFFGVPMTRKHELTDTITFVFVYLISEKSIVPNSEFLILNLRKVEKYIGSFVQNLYASTRNEFCPRNICLASIEIVELSQRCLKKIDKLYLALWF